MNVYSSNLNSSTPPLIVLRDVLAWRQAAQEMATRQGKDASSIDTSAMKRQLAVSLACLPATVRDVAPYWTPALDTVAGTRRSCWCQGWPHVAHPGTHRTQPAPGTSSSCQDFAATTRI